MYINLKNYGKKKIENNYLLFGLIFGLAIGSILGTMIALLIGCLQGNAGKWLPYGHAIGSSFGLAIGISIAQFIKTQKKENQKKQVRDESHL